MPRGDKKEERTDEKFIALDVYAVRKDATPSNVEAVRILVRPRVLLNLRVTSPERRRRGCGELRAATR
jgi:hypothetical protein